MGFTFLKKLPTPAEIRNQYPIDAAIQELKAKRDQEIRDVFTGFVCVKCRIKLQTKF